MTTSHTAKIDSIRLAAAFLAVLSLAGWGAFAKSTKATSEISKTQSGYQAVFLDSGAVFFGQLQGLGTEYPALTHDFYVRSVTSAETKQSSNILIKRGKEWHGPDRTTLNAQHILFVEPVTAGSQVANLIEQAGQDVAK
jgi:hypothetical protein